MRLTLYSDYTLRLLMYVAAKPTELVAIADISRAYGISKNHLMKITHQLALEGLIETTRGRNGGLRLAKPAGAINIGHVVRLTEAGSLLVECCDPVTNTCVITRACKLRHILMLALEDFYKRLDKYTLADLVEEPGSLLMLFKN